MIASRKDMLQTFLVRFARHPILSNEYVSHRFFDGEVSWVSAAVTRLHDILLTVAPLSRRQKC